MPPATCSLAYKEWAGICEALADGRQTILLRKGGTSEGPSGFLPDAPAFWFWPTHLHEAEQGLKWPAAPGPVLGQGGLVELAPFAVVDSALRVERMEALERIADWHAWSEETVAKRFMYRAPGLWALIVRAYRQDAPPKVQAGPRHAGCKTWVHLDEAIAVGALRPVLDDEEFERRKRATLEALQEPVPLRH